MTIDPGEGRVDRSGERRAAAERVLQYAEALRPADQALLRAIYDRGMTAGDFARVVGQRPRALRRRVRRLVERVGCEQFQFVLRTRHDWPGPRRRVAELVFLQGESQRATAQRLGLSLHRVRQEIQRVRGMIEYRRQGNRQERAR